MIDEESLATTGEDELEGDGAPAEATADEDATLLLKSSPNLN